MSFLARLPLLRATLKGFLEEFQNYVDEVHDHYIYDERLAELQRNVPAASHAIVGALGHGTVRIGADDFNYGDMLSNAVIEGNMATVRHLRDFEGPVISLLNRAIGAIDSGVVVKAAPQSVLVIHDAQLRERCHDLLAAPGNYDRVVREATTVLEDRIRGKPGHAVLARAIPTPQIRQGIGSSTHCLPPTGPS